MERLKHPYIKFTGDYAKLKTMGYVFQRLYAGNYMQWCNAGTRVWKKGSEVTFERCINSGGQLLELLLDYKERNEPIPVEHTCIVLFLDTRSDTLSLDRTAYREQQKAWYAYNVGEPEPPYHIEQILIKPDTLGPLSELIKLEWVEVAYYNEP